MHVMFQGKTGRDMGKEDVGSVKEKRYLVGCCFLFRTIRTGMKWK